MADTLTDAELRKRLTALGYDVGPLNASTRPLWMKRLGKKAEPKKVTKAPSKPSTTAKKVAIGFSSDESDQETTKSTVTRGKARSTRVTKTTTRSRSTAAVSMPPPPAALTRPALRRRSTPNNVAQSKTTPSRVSARSQDESPKVLNSTFVFDESDTDITDSPAVSLTTISTNTSPTVERHLDTPAASPSASRSEPIVRPLSTSTPEKTNAKNKLQLFKETSRTAPKYSRSIDRSDLFIPNASSNPIKTNRSYGNKSVNNKRQKLDSSFDDSLSDEEEIIQQGFQTQESMAYSWTQYISLILLVVLTGFFLVLAATYINMRGVAEKTYSAQKDNLMLCDTDAISDSKETIGPCFTAKEVEKVLSALKPLYKVLSVSAGQHDCGYLANFKYRHLTRLEVKTIAKGVNQTTMFYLIMNNKHWNIRLLGEQFEADVEDPDKVWFVESTAPSYPVLCRVKRLLSKMLSWIIAMVLVAFTSVIMWVLYRFDQRKKREERALVYDMVENIIETLKSHYDSSMDNKDVQPYMAIPHVRDMLIAPQDRSKKQSIWDQAVKFLAANESRIRVESQVISGEEFPVWRWLHGYAASTSKGKKMWQGQAFGESPSNRGNTLPFSPTPCLKIRNMFDPNIEVGEWEVGIRDVILEKCQAIDDIVHISVDKTSTEGCVYLKCGTPAGAGKVYKALHGWWFDGNLVTVKFLRLERYYERFPDSKKCTTVLKPASAQSSWFSTL